MTVRNVLFVMCDQLRADYVGVAGHPFLKTPNIDALAARGVRFTRAYVQSPVCGSSRMCFYTGRTVASHGAIWNNVPLRVGEPTLGDHLRPHGLRVAVVGKTHAVGDTAGLQRLGLDASSDIGQLVVQAGFEPVARDDGLHPSKTDAGQGPYERYLRRMGYDDPHPWERFANAGEDADGTLALGWFMRNARKPARVKAEHSETAWTTDEAIAFLEAHGDKPFLLHVSYIKPHWPYIAPAPYHDLYGPNQVIAPIADAREQVDPHPVFGAFMDLEESRNFSRREVRETVIPAYMGLIAEIDHHIGRLMAALQRLGRDRDTLIVLTADHGDYLGDHWLGEKELFHEPSVRVPMLIVDPTSAANATRGTVSDALVESIDLAPTFLDRLGLTVPMHVFEGRSLSPLLDGAAPGTPWRSEVYSEIDFAFRLSRTALRLAPDEARAWMIRTERWKYVRHANYRPQLFDLVADPNEFDDRGGDPAMAGVIADMERRLLARLLDRKHRITISDAEIEQRTGTAKQRGYLIGVW
jgi:arylsulfatase A-like enzyme